MNESPPSSGIPSLAVAARRALVALAATLALAACSDGAKKKFVASTNGGGTSQQGVATLSALFAGAQFAPGQPAVGAVSPADGEQAVPLTAPIVVIFSESVDPKTVTATSITLSFVGSSFGGGFGGGGNPGPVPAALALDPSTANRVAVLLPAQDLQPNSQYLIRVSTDIRDLEGEALTVPGGTSGGGSGGLFGGNTSSAREFRFTTVSAATQTFRLMTLFPEPAAKNVAPATPVILYFSDAVALNGPNGLKTVDNLRVSALGQKLEGTVTAALDPRIVVFVPKKPFSPGAQVSVRVNNSVADQDGVLLSADQPIEESFTVSNIRMPTAITFPGNAPFSFAGSNFAGTMTLDDIKEFRASVTVGGSGAAPDTITRCTSRTSRPASPRHACSQRTRTADRRRSRTT
ncbi:MAG: Ig-like domain-containing protein [Planctomycetes bacterium]|nr:Ig-like domain-containing protein [Planctomycetota bacterium]